MTRVLYCRSNKNYSPNSHGIISSLSTRKSISHGIGKELETMVLQQAPGKLKNMVQSSND